MSTERHRAAILGILDQLVGAVNYEDLANRIVRRFAEMVDAELCTLWRKLPVGGEDYLVLSASVGFERKPGEEIPTYPVNWDATQNERIEGVTAWIAVRNALCLANSYHDLARNSHSPWYGSHRGRWDNLQFMAGAPERSFRSLLGIPLTRDHSSPNEGAQELTPKATADASIGVLKAENSRKSGGFDENDVALATEIAPFIALTLESMIRRERHEHERQLVLRELTSALPILDLVPFYQQVVDRTAKLLSADVCSLWLVEDEAQLVLAANYGVRDRTDIPVYYLTPAEDDTDIDGLTAWVAIRKRPFFAAKFEDLKTCAAHRGKWDGPQWEGKPQDRFGCLYAVPLLREEKAIGVLKIENPKGKHIFDEVDKTTFDVMAGFIALAIELSRRLRFEVVFDFFHMLRAPTSTAILAFRSLREELALAAPRAHRVEQAMGFLSSALASVRTWTLNVYGLSTLPDPRGEAKSPIAFGDILRKTITDLRMLLPEFKCSLDVGNFKVNLTPLQSLKAGVIFFNLLDNSFKYSVEPRSIEVEAKSVSGRIQVSVRDNGRGIPASDQPRIFEPFFRGEIATQTEGMGLGLATVSRLVDQLGWHCDVQSESGKGTCFSIYVPRTQERADGNESGAEADHRGRRQYFRPDADS